MKIKHQIAAACVVALAAVSAQAQTTAGSGLYIGGSIGQSKWRGDTVPGTDTSNTGGKLYGGYEFSPNFALELGYVELGKFNSDITSVKANGPYLDAVGKFPFAPNWSGLLRAGLFQGKAEIDGPGFSDDDKGTGYKYGLGVQYDLSAAAGVRVEYERYTLKVYDEKPDTDLLSVGFNYRF